MMQHGFSSPASDEMDGGCACWKSRKTEGPYLLHKGVDNVRRDALAEAQAGAVYQ